MTERIDYGGGDVVYKLYNPWGKNEQPQLVPYRELAKYFNYVDVGTVGRTP